MESLTLQPIARVDGTINLPGSKSVSNRALLLAALAHGKTMLTNLLDSDDVRHMLNALTALGVQAIRFQLIVRVAKLSVTAVHYTQKVPWSCSFETPERQCKARWRQLFVWVATILCWTGEPRMKEAPDWSSGGCPASWRGEDRLPGTRTLSAIAFTGRFYWRQR
ncbi:hypothetical protein MF573_10010 [Klebsiella pneumoniae]|nr:hypothetical protein MF573_10010 [Klebsiella pneumoniae]